MRATPKDRSERLSEEEVKIALLNSGFPLEVRLLKAFKLGGMDPIIGFRVVDSEGKSREIDLMASFHTAHPVAPNTIMNVELKLVIEAKGFEPAEEFVGLTWEPPSDREMHWGRAYFGGFPSSRVVEVCQPDGNLVVGDDSLCEAFKPMNKAAYCVQWAVAKRKSGGAEQHLFANHEPNVWNGMDGVVRASHAMMKDYSLFTSRFNLKQEKSRQISIQFIVPVLVLAREKLWLFDAVSGTTSTAPRIVLSRVFESEGHVHHRLVDVVVENAVPDFIRACRSTFDVIERRCRSHADDLLELGERQALELQKKATRRVLRAPIADK